MRCSNNISTIFWNTSWVQTCQKCQKPVCPGNPDPEVHVLAHLGSTQAAVTCQNFMYNMKQPNISNKLSKMQCIAKRAGKGQVTLMICRLLGTSEPFISYLCISGILCSAWSRFWTKNTSEHRFFTLNVRSRDYWRKFATGTFVHNLRTVYPRIKN